MQIRLTYQVRLNWSKQKKEFVLGIICLYHRGWTGQSSVLAKHPQEKIIIKISSTVCILAVNQKKLHKNKATITYN